LTKEQMDKFAKEDPKIKRHLEITRRKDLLELVLDKMEGLRQLEGRETTRSRGSAGKPRNGGRWGLF